MKTAAFFAPKALHFPPMAAHPATGFSPPLLLGAFGTVFCPVAPGDEGLAAQGAAFPGVNDAYDFRVQLRVSREDGGTEILADGHRRDKLGAGVEIAVIQTQTVPTVIRPLAKISDSDKIGT